MTRHDYIDDLEALIDFQAEMETPMYDRLKELLEDKMNLMKTNELDYDNPENIGSVQND